jgi:hypothetical protein
MVAAWWLRPALLVTLLPGACPELPDAATWPMKQRDPANAGPVDSVCWNLTTRRIVVIPDGARSWDCEGAGLRANPGDRLRSRPMPGGLSSPSAGPPLSCTPR